MKGNRVKFTEIHGIGRVLPLLAVALLTLLFESAMADRGSVTVYKTPNCGCCTLWVEHMREYGFDVDVKSVSETRSLRAHFGIPDSLASCHTAVAGDYWVEGHVPADLVSRLLAEHPDAIRGIAAPGMPLGSPGMEAPNATTYDVVTLDDQGNVEVYETVHGQSR